MILIDQIQSIGIDLRFGFVQTYGDGIVNHSPVKYGRIGIDFAGPLLLNQQMIDQGRLIVFIFQFIIIAMGILPHIDLGNSIDQGFLAFQGIVAMHNLNGSILAQTNQVAGLNK